MLTQIRLRLWNDPKSEDGEPYGAGNNDLAETIAIGKKGYRCRLWSAFEFPLQ